MRPPHDVHKVNAYTAESVCPSIRVFQLQKGCTDFDEILYGFYAIHGQPDFVLFDFLQSIIRTERSQEVVRWERLERHLI